MNTNRLTTAALWCAALALTTPAEAQLFDDFNTAASAAKYNIVTSSADTDVEFGFDYSALGIPQAPGTPDASTLALRMAVNIVDPAATEAVTLHTLQSFSGDYTVTFDAWINANGPFPDGGGGSTEFLTAGVGGDGVTFNRGGTANSGSGGWTAVTGEGGSTRDYRMFKDDGEQFAESSQFEAGTSSADGGAHNSSDPYYSQFGGIDVGALGQGGSQTGNSGPGTFGFAWHAVELAVDEDGGTGGQASVAWSIDGLLIGTLNAGIGSSFDAVGSLAIGYMDIFTSVSDAAEFSFGLIDNLAIGGAALPGDIDGNGTVDMMDFGILRDNLFTGTARAQGDLDGDRDVDLDDFGIFKSVFPAGAAPAPEPSSLLLLVAGATGLIAGNRLRRKRGLVHFSASKGHHCRSVLAENMDLSPSRGAPTG